MDDWMVSLVSVLSGAVIGIGGSVLHLYLSQRGDRRKELWRSENARVFDVEERAGQLVEIIGGHGNLEDITAFAAEGLPRLQRDAGRFRRHLGLMQAIRNLQNGLARLHHDKSQHLDYRDTSNEVNTLFEQLLLECDKVTGRRRI